MCILFPYITYTRKKIRDFFQSFSEGCRIISRAEFLEEVWYLPISSLQGAEVVREDLIDEIAKESGPYQPPEKIMRRSDMATDFSTPQQRIIKPNE